MNRNFAVYQLIDGGNVVYVGMTQQPDRRFSQHKTNGTCSRSATMKIVRRFKTIRGAYRHEERLIRSLNPPKNTYYKRQEYRYPGMMPMKEAMHIWLSKPEEWNEWVICDMPGWSINRALYHFGSSRDRSPRVMKMRKKIDPDYN